MDWGLLILRLVVGLLFVGHGSQKVFGWFEGPGPKGQADNVEAMGWRPGLHYAYLLGLSELLGGLLLAFGFLTPLVAGVLIAVMLNAIWVVHRPHGLWNTAGGIEFPLVMATAAWTLAFTGAGTFSLDAAPGWELSGGGWGLTALAVGVAGWLVGMAARTWGDRIAGHRPRHPRQMART